jgi:drug/metabolite transporter (DMT)-like permease
MAPQEQPPEIGRAPLPGGRLLVSPYTASVFAMLCWAGSTVIVRYVREDAPPLRLSFWRTLAAFFILLPFAFGPLRRQWPLVRRSWRILALLALLLWVGGNALLFVSLQYTIAINAAVINSVEPVIIAFFAWLLFRDPFTWRQGIGVALSLAGVLTLISAGSVENLLRLAFNRGDLIVTGAYIAWGLYAVLLRRAPRELDHRVTVVALLGFGAVMLLPLYLLEAVLVRPTPPLSATTLVTVLYLAVFSSAIAMLLWNRAILQLGAARAGQFIHLIPAFTVVLAITLLGEVMGGHHVAGIVLIAAGLTVASR